MTEMPVRRLTVAGIARFKAMLQEARSHAAPNFASLIADPALTERVHAEVYVSEDPPSSVRADIGLHLYERLKPLGAANVLGDTRLWAWLSLAWIDMVAPQGKSSRKVGADYRHIPSEVWSSYYRHLLRTPYRITARYEGDVSDAMVVLCSDVANPGEPNEQLASRQSIVGSRSIIAAATKLYYNPSTKDLVEGFSVDSSPGNIRRFPIIVDMLSLTRDLPGMTADGIIEILPKEFNGFKP